MAQLVKYLSKHEDQRSVNKSQNPTLIPVLGRQRHEASWACCPPLQLKSRGAGYGVTKGNVYLGGT